MSADRLLFEDVSKFYGEVLGINRVNLSIPPGITSLVGPNGSGKSTLMNLMTGLLRPSRGRVRILGLDLSQPVELFRRVGYCSQWDSFPNGATGRSFIESTLRLHGYGPGEARRMTDKALQRVRLSDAADRRVAGYSKGMRQRVKLAQSIAHEPVALVLDEPLNGLDPMARADVIELFRDWAGEGRHLIISSHILHEVDMISDRVIILAGGYVVAEGDIRTVRSEMDHHPMQVSVRCARPEVLAARLFSDPGVVEVKLDDDRRGLLVRTRDAHSLYALLNAAVIDMNLQIETIAPTDEDVNAVYQYLLGSREELSA